MKIIFMSVIAVGLSGKAMFLAQKCDRLRKKIKIFT